MIKKIILVFENPFNQFNYDRFGIDLLIKNGFNVEYWDILEALYPGTVINISQNRFEFSGFRQFASKQDVITAIKKLSEVDIIITPFNYQFKYLWFFQAVSKSQCYYAIMHNNPGSFNYVTKNKNLNTMNRLLLKLTMVTRNLFAKRYSGGLIKQRIFSYIPYELFKLKPPRFLFFGGNEDIRKNLKHLYNAEYTKMIAAHNFDYDLYLQRKLANNNKYPSNSIVFIDQNFPFHSDDTMSQWGYAVNEKEYYPSICRFFEHIEKEFNVNVIIATHPDVRQDQYHNFFGKRQCVKNKTFDLISQAKLVLMHDSSAINFVVLYQKPVLFFFTKEMLPTREAEVIKQMAKWFGREAVNCDEPYSINCEKELAIDKKLYSYYKETFIKPRGSEELPLWQIVSNAIKEI